MPNHTNSKTILITGTSSGFGLLTAARLASQNHMVIATMRNLNKKQDLIKEAHKRGGRVEIVPMDVTDHASINKAKEFVSDKFGTLDVLVNNAGYGIGGFFEDLTEKEIRDQMETNFFGVQNVTRAFLPLLKKSKTGKIINISSVSGFSTSPCFGAYNASKWALEAFSENLMYEMKLFGIDVHLIEPGIYRTKIFEENSRTAANYNNPQSPYFTLSQSLKERVMNNVFACKKDPEDIARLTEKLIHAKNAGLRHIPDFPSKILFLLRKFLPFRAYRYLVRKAVFGKITKID